MGKGQPQAQPGRKATLDKTPAPPRAAVVAGAPTPPAPLPTANVHPDDITFATCRSDFTTAHAWSVRLEVHPSQVAALNTLGAQATLQDVLEASTLSSLEFRGNPTSNFLNGLISLRPNFKTPDQNFSEICYRQPLEFSVGTKAADRVFPASVTYTMTLSELPNQIELHLLTVPAKKQTNGDLLHLSDEVQSVLKDIRDFGKEEAPSLGLWHLLPQERVQQMLKFLNSLTRYHVLLPGVSVPRLKDTDFELQRYVAEYIRRSLARFDILHLASIGSRVHLHDELFELLDRSLKNFNLRVPLRPTAQKQTLPSIQFETLALFSSSQQATTAPSTKNSLFPPHTPSFMLPTATAVTVSSSLFSSDKSTTTTPNFSLFSSPPVRVIILPAELNRSETVEQYRGPVKQTTPTTTTISKTQCSGSEENFVSQQLTSDPTSIPARNTAEASTPPESDATQVPATTKSPHRDLTSFVLFSGPRKWVVSHYIDHITGKAMPIPRYTDSAEKFPKPLPAFLLPIESVSQPSPTPPPPPPPLPVDCSPHEAPLDNRPHHLFDQVQYKHSLQKPSREIPPRGFQNLQSTPPAPPKPPDPRESSRSRTAKQKHQVSSRFHNRTPVSTTTNARPTNYCILQKLAQDKSLRKPRQLQRFFQQTGPTNFSTPKKEETRRLSRRPTTTQRQPFASPAHRRHGITSLQKSPKPNHYHYSASATRLTITKELLTSTTTRRSHNKPRPPPQLPTGFAQLFHNMTLTRLPQEEPPPRQKGNSRSN